MSIFHPKKNRKNSAVVFLGGDGGGCCSEQAEPASAVHAIAVVVGGDDELREESAVTLGTLPSYSSGVGPIGAGGWQSGCMCGGRGGGGEGIRKAQQKNTVQRSKQEEERISRGTYLLLCCGFGDGGCIELDEFMGVEAARRSLQL